MPQCSALRALVVEVLVWQEVVQLSVELQEVVDEDE